MEVLKATNRKNIGLFAQWSGRAFILTVATVTNISLLSCAYAYDKAELTGLEFTRIDNDSSSAERYPFALSALSEINEDRIVEPDLEASVLISQFNVQNTNTLVRVAIVRKEGPLYCGTAGCLSYIYDINTQRMIGNVSMHPSSSSYLMNCPSYSALLLRSARGTLINWAEWRYINESFTYVRQVDDINELHCDNSAK